MPHFTNELLQNEQIWETDVHLGNVQLKGIYTDISVYHHQYILMISRGRCAHTPNIFHTRMR